MGELFQDIFFSGRTLIVELIIVGLFFYLFEKLKPAQQGVPFFKKEFRNELAWAGFNLILMAPIYVLIVGAILTFIMTPYVPYQMFDGHIQSLPLIAQVLLGMFILDFSTYWRHRFTHNYMWSYHSIHHSAEELTWITTLRMHPIDILAAVTLDMFILHLFGFTGPGIFFSIMAFKAYNYFTHANVDFQFSKPLRYVFASPNFHRWHHAREKEGHNKNFCSVFSCFDLAFGTFHHPEDRLPISYGLEDRQKENYPDDFWGQMLYPFRRDIAYWKRQKAKKKQSKENQ